MFRTTRPVLLISLALVAACGESEHPTATRLPGAETAFHRESDGNGWSDWSAPVKVGPPISVPFVTDGNATLSPDGLSLYYDSDRTDLPGAQGARDMWVSRRDCADALDPDCAWQTPVNLGPLLNTPFVDGGPKLSVDGHLLFFLSHGTRPDCPAEQDEADPTRPCDADIFVSWRANPNDDLGWGPPVPLHALNTGDEDNVEAFVSVGEPGRGNLYFSRGPVGTSQLDIHYVPIRVASRGAATGPVVDVLGAVVAATELNLAAALDAGVTVSRSGTEIFFFSSANRPGKGALDIWTSTRRSPHDPWGAAVNVTALNTARADLAPQLSRDGEMLLFTSNRELANPACIARGLPGSCGWDIYMSTRRKVAIDD